MGDDEARTRAQVDYHDQHRQHSPEQQPGAVLSAEEVRRRWGLLSPLAQAYGRFWDISRADTESDLMGLFQADADLVTEGSTEYFSVFPEYLSNPPPHGQATP